MIDFLRDFISDLLKNKYIASLIIFLYVSVIFIVISLVDIYNNINEDRTRITVIEQTNKL